MTRMLTCLVIVFLLPLGIAFAAPARPLYEPAIPDSSSARIGNLGGSAWVGNFAKIELIFIFETDGTLSYSIKQKTIPNFGKWRLEGNVLTFEMQSNAKGAPPRKILEFRGVFTDSGAIVGEQISAAGVKTPMTLQRTTMPAK
jgi:hypothetical protein